MSGEASPVPPSEAPAPAAAPAASARAVWMGLTAVVAWCFHAAQPVPWDGDTGFHLVVARLMVLHRSTLDAFPWTPWSWLADHYADKELLFHALLMPWSGLELGTAGLWAGTVFTTGVLWTLLAVMGRQGVKDPGPWVLVLLFGSAFFLKRVTILRPHLLSIPLMLLLVQAALQRRHRWVAAVGALFPLAYVGWPVAVGVVGLVELVRRGVERTWHLRNVAGILLGILVGVVAHPHFPHHLQFTWLQLGGVLLRGAWLGGQPVTLGGEFSPLQEGQGVTYAVPLLLLAGAVVQLARTRTRDSAAAAWLVLGGVFLAAAFRTPRFIEYAVPMVGVGAAVVLGPRVPRGALLGLAGVALAVLQATGQNPVQHYQTRSVVLAPPLDRMMPAAVPVGSQVITCHWELTGELMLGLPDRRFVVALDPTFFHVAYPEEFAVWSRLTQAPPAQPARWLREHMGGDYLLCESATVRPDHAALMDALKGDPWATPVLVGDPWMLFRLGPPEGSSSAP